MYKEKNHFSVFARKRSDGKKVYYYYCYDESGRRVKRSTGATSKAKAMDIIAKRIEQDCLLMTEQVSIAVAKAKNIDAAEYFLKFFLEDCPICRQAELRGKPVSKRKKSTTRQVIVQYMVPFFQGKALVRVSANDIRSWQMYLKDKGLKPTTINAYYIMLNKILNYALDDGIIERSPAENVKPLYAAIEERAVFTPEEIVQIFSIPWRDPLVCLACKLAASTGMRVGEIRALRYNSIKNGIIEISASLTPDRVLKTTKSGKTRYCPIPYVLDREIQSLKALRFADDDDFIFSLDNVSPVTASHINRQLKKALIECGLSTDKSMHSFRHFFNSMLVSENVNGELLRSVIGHESKEMTDHYMHAEIADMTDIREVQKKILG